jgi:hypothetical protein
LEGEVGTFSWRRKGEEKVEEIILGGGGVLKEYKKPFRDDYMVSHHLVLGTEKVWP